MWLFCSVRVTARWVIIDDIFIRQGEDRETEVIAAFDNLYGLGVAINVVSFLSVSFADMTMVCNELVVRLKSDCSL